MYNCEIPCERVPYLSALEVWSRQGAIKFHVYLYLTFTLRRTGIARFLKGSHSFTRTSRVHPHTEWTNLPLPSQQKLVLIYRTAEGWKAELALGGWLVTYRNNRELNAGTVAYLSTNSLLPMLVQFVQRVLVMLMPPKYQPDYMFLRNVPMRRVHLFTVIQLGCIMVLCIIKELGIVSIVFPVMVSTCQDS